MPKFCCNCGAPLEAEAKFCGECGKPVFASANNVTAKPTADSLEVTEKLQTELYSLYRILEPVRELDLAGRKISAKISELSGHQAETNNKYRSSFMYYMPFISVEVPENLITPVEKWQKKEWGLFIKAQDEKKYGVKRFHKPTLPPSYEFIYDLFKSNEATVMQNLDASFLYYKMQYCFDNPPESRFWTESILKYKLINTNVFFDFLGSKLGSKRDDYIAEICTKLGSNNRGNEELCDVLEKYQYVTVNGEYDYFFLQKHGFPPKRDYDEMGAVTKANLQKSIHTKKQLDGSVAEFRKIKGQIDAKIGEYMKDVVDKHIEKNIEIVPVSYARNWETVSYFLYLIVNKRGRDIYEVINQYEIDMKHKELTSALADISTEINNQTNTLVSKLDDVNKSIISMTSAITYSISHQTKVLEKKLDNINYSIMETGANVVGAISDLGASMAQTMNNMKINISVR